MVLKDIRVCNVVCALSSFHCSDSVTSCMTGRASKLTYKKLATFVTEGSVSVQLEK